MILTIDIGNSRTKWGVFDAAGALLGHGVTLNSERIVAPLLWASCEQAIIANVAGDAQMEKVGAILKEMRLPFKCAKSTLKACGVENSYVVSSQLGVDRWAAMIGAWKQLSKACVVVSAGTALTIDVLLASNDGAIFKGGFILPGLQLMQASLLSNTAQLTEKSQQALSFKPSGLPVNTLDAIQQGAMLAAVSAVSSVFECLQQQRQQVFVCMITGGNATQLAQGLHNHGGMVNNVLVSEYLVLQGLFALERESQ